MTEIIQFAFLGLGAAAVYALLAQGIVVIYRGSGVLNFAQGAMAMVAAFSYYELQRRGWPFIPALLVSMAVGAALGALTQVLAMRPLRDASPLTRVIATLGIVVILQSAGTLVYEDEAVIVESPLPKALVHIGGTVFPSNRLWLFGIAVITAAILYMVFRFTRVGLAASAVAESEQRAAAFGWSPDLMALGSWALGGALAGLAGVLVIPITGLNVTNLGLLIIPAMAVALVGGFSSLPLMVLGAAAIGIAQSEVGRYVSEPGWANTVPLLAIIVILVIRGQALPVRGHLITRLPSIGSGRIDPRVAGGVVAVTVLLALFAFNDTWTLALTATATAALFLLSIVVITGYAGQLSLAQYAMGGLGALLTGRLAADGWPFELAIVAGLGGALVIGLLFALPALRTRGVNLAVVTLSLGVAIQDVVFRNSKYTGGIDGTEVGGQTFFGIDIDPIKHADRYSVFAVVCLTVATLAVGNIRRSRSGRRLIAVRTNERAAASVGVSVFGAKMYGFAVSAVIAGLGGIVYAFANYTAVYGQFSPLSSITAVTQAVVGGVGYLIGPLIGSTLAAGAFGSLLGDVIHVNYNWIALASGVILVATLALAKDGLADYYVRMLAPTRDRLQARAERRRAKPKESLPLPAPGTQLRRGGPASLSVAGLSVRFGGVTALNDVTFTAAPGELVGIIGPNGAGKTTLLDAITGFVKPAAGSVLLNDTPLDRSKPHQRVRLGLTRSFQSLELFDDLTIRENLLVASDDRDALAYVTTWVVPGQRELSPAATLAIHEFGLADVLDRRPSELPYGQRRLVAIARAVATEPSVLLLDEPAAGLAETEAEELGHLLRRLTGEWGITVLLVEHNVSLVMGICERVVVLDFGRKIAEGRPDEVRRDPATVAAYLGSSHEEAAPAGADTHMSNEGAHQ